jgi:hypothetical protein
MKFICMRPFVYRYFTGFAIAKQRKGKKNLSFINFLIYITFLIHYITYNVNFSTYFKTLSFSKFDQ